MTEQQLEANMTNNKLNSKLSVVEFEAQRGTTGVTVCVIHCCVMMEVQLL